MTLAFPAVVNDYTWGTPVQITSGDLRWNTDYTSTSAHPSEYQPPFVAIPPDANDIWVPTDPVVVTLKIRMQGNISIVYTYGPSGVTKISPWGPDNAYTAGMYAFSLDTSILPMPPQRGTQVFYQWSGSGGLAACNRPPAPYFNLYAPEL